MKRFIWISVFVLNLSISYSQGLPSYKATVISGVSICSLCSLLNALVLERSLSNKMYRSDVELKAEELKAIV